MRTPRAEQHMITTGGTAQVILPKEIRDELAKLRPVRKLDPEDPPCVRCGGPTHREPCMEGECDVCEQCYFHERRRTPKR
jgi:hypothetical protein